MAEIKWLNFRFIVFFQCTALAMILSMAACSAKIPVIVPDSTNVNNADINNKALSNKLITQSTIHKRLPFSFEPNQGQANQSAKFIARGSGFSLNLSEQDASLVLLSSKRLIDNRNASFPELAKQEMGKSGVLRMRYIGANPKVKLVGIDNLPGTVNYLVGNVAQQWKTNIPTYAKVRYKELYPGVDLLYYGRQGRLEYDFIVKAGVNPDSIRLAFEGAEKLDVDQDGNLIFHLNQGKIRQTKPFIYQMINGVTHKITGGYSIQDNNNIGFNIASYDPSYPLIIDPVLEYSSFLGGPKPGSDNGTDIAVDNNGNVYITGTTVGGDFPTLNPLQPNNSGSKDVFIVKLNPDATAILYATYLGGKKEDEGTGITVDANGNAYVTGSTKSRDFPVINPLQPDLAGNHQDVFLAQISSDGSELGFSTYFGGTRDDKAESIALDDTDQIYITGSTRSADFPTSNAIQPELAGNSDSFVTQFLTDGTGVGYSTYLGGKAEDQGLGIAVNTSGSAVVTGYTKSKNFPAINSVQSNLAGDQDAFVTQITTDGGVIGFSTYLGGQKNDQAHGVAIDELDRIYVAGFTRSSDFPIANALQPEISGKNDIFISQLNASGTRLGFSTFLGGTKDDFAFDIDVNSIGAAFVTGYTKSADFPTTNPIQPDFAKVQDAFVAAIDHHGSALIYSTFLGGNKKDQGQGIAVDDDGNTYITGETRSKDFPTFNPLQPTLENSKSAFVTQIALLPPVIEFEIPVDGAELDAGAINFKIIFEAGDVDLDLATFQLLINNVDVAATTDVTSTGATYTATSLPGGENIAIAQISDVAGITRSATVQFNVRTTTGFRAIADCAPTNGTAPLTVRYRSRGEFEAGSIVRYRWDFQGDGTFDTNDSVARDFNFTFNQSGTFNPVLEVTNNLGDTTTDTCPIVVAGNAPTATANVIPSNGPVPLDVSLTCSGSDPDGTIALYEWDFEGDGVFDFSSPTSGNTTHTYTNVGTFAAVCRVTDNDGKTTEARTTTSVIRPAPPGSPSVNASASPSSGNGPLTVSFNGTATDDGTIVLWEWDFDGDGTFDFSSPTSPATSFTYNDGGIFAPGLKVTDNEGKTGIDTVEVIVNLSATLSVSPDTFDPDAGDTGTINTTLSAGVPFRLLIKDESGNIVRTLVDTNRAAGNYSDTWDGLDDNSNRLPEGPYFAVLEYDFFGEVRTVDLTNTTGGARSNPPRTPIPRSFAPFAGQPLTIDFTLNRASEVLAFIGRFNVDTRLVTFLNRQPLGKGTHRLTWNGENAEGQLIHPPSGDSFLFGIFGFTLPDNAMYLQSGATVSGLSVGPPIFDPSGHIDDQGTPEQSAMTFTLSKTATAELIVSDATTGGVVATRTYPNLVAGENTVFWNGRDDNGIYIAPGRYRLGIAAIDSTGYKSLRVYAVQRIYY